MLATTIMFPCLATWPVSAADSIQAVGTIGYCGAPAGIRFTWAPFNHHSNAGSLEDGDE
jgi:hypothetical protein